MLIIGNGLVITRDSQNTLINNGAVAVEGDSIIDVGETDALKTRYEGYQYLDANRKIIMPGLINTHMHFYSTFARGMALKDPPPTNFAEILQRLWWRLDRALTLEDVYYSALVPAVDCIKNGVTTVFDHNASQNCVSGSLFKIAEATKRAGLRSCLCYEVSDRDGEDAARKGIQENVDFMRHCRSAKDGMIRGMFGLHASLTLSDKTLESCLRENEGSGAGFHIHAAEGVEDRRDAHEKYGSGVVERLNSRGILGQKSIAVHCIHISDSEIGILKETGTIVVHNPESNMGNAVGTAPVLEMYKRGVLLGLGTDGYTSDMLESLKAANCLLKHASADPGAGWAEPPAMLFDNNRIIAEKYFDKPLGVLQKGACADIIIVDYVPPTPLTPENINSHLLFGASGKAVRTTIADGKLLMHNGVLQHLDEQEICEKSREAAGKLWERF